MKTVLIDDKIGYNWWDGSGVTAKKLKQQLDGILDGEEINIVINSPGGSVYEGAVIFNLIRDYAKSHPVSVRINCLAMSMASYIALAARTVNKDSKITVCDNSIFMIHNPWMYTWGDYRELKKDSDYLEKLAAMYGSVHCITSGKSEKDIRKAMDEETFYVGKEIIDAGFANEYEAFSNDDDGIAASAGEITPNTLDRDTLVRNAKTAANEAMEAARAAGQKDGKAYRGDLEKAVAFYQVTTPPAAAGGEIITSGGGGNMKPEELLAKNKDCYDAVFALGEKAALEKERARVQAHIMLGKEAGALDTAVKYIEGGESSMDEKIRAEYLALSMKKSRLEARNDDDVGDTNLGGDGKADGKALADAFRAGVRGKMIGGTE
ncbi:MAG: Clp protease ClpP [Treponema sp.]|nr:Clp protease ClpP [Treponema sp.]